MRTAVAVIGANYGDEGKGRVVDALATEDDLVIRHSGGSQAGHTVSQKGFSHVFSHIGAGTFKGAKTFLGPAFVCNPIRFRGEFEKLYSLMELPKIYVDPRARVTTPYDMMVNQELERARGNARHGSCGAGIHETVLRHQSLPITVSTKIDRDLVKRARAWSFERLCDCEEWSGFTPERADQFYSDDLVTRWLEDVEFSNSWLRKSRVQEIGFQNALFEGAQGLGLDEKFGYFPYVTHSRTGLWSAQQVLFDLRIYDVTTYYVTRAYATRHGAGPLPNEHSTCRVEDPTNVTNPWQGSFRTGDLDVDAMADRITKDVFSVSVVVQPKIVVTCLDHKDVDANADLKLRDLTRLVSSPLLVSDAPEGDLQEYR